MESQPQNPEFKTKYNPKNLHPPEVFQFFYHNGKKPQVNSTPINIPRQNYVSEFNNQRGVLSFAGFYDETAIYTTI